MGDAQQQRIKTSTAAAIKRTQLDMELQEKDTEKTATEQQLKSIEEGMQANANLKADDEAKVATEKIRVQGLEDQKQSLDKEMSDKHETIEKLWQKSTASPGEDPELQQLQSTLNSAKTAVQKAAVRVNQTEIHINARTQKVVQDNKDVETAEAKYSALMDDAIHIRGLEEKAGAKAESVQDLLSMKMRVAKSALDDLEMARVDKKAHQEESGAEIQSMRKETTDLETQFEQAKEALKNAQEVHQVWSTKVDTAQTELKKHELALEEAKFEHEVSDEMEGISR